MYNCTKLHTGSAVARVTKDRAARPHLPSTVENQLGRRRQRRQLLTIGQRNVRTLLGTLFLLEWQTRRRKKGGQSGLCYQKGYRHKADRYATASK